MKKAENQDQQVSNETGSGVAAVGGAHAVEPGQQSAAHARNSRETVTRLCYGDREIIVVGTAHVSRSSVEEVERVIAEETPDRVCVEIDRGRYESVTGSSGWKNLDIYEVLRRKKGFLLLGNLVLASFQRRVGQQLGVRPGEEMIEAVRAAERAGVPVSLCDREVQTTLRRAWAKSGFWGKNKMLAALLGSIFSREKLSDEDIEEMKQGTSLDNMLQELSAYLPRAKEVLIDERDRYLATRIWQADGSRIVAVVGAGHVSGMLAHLEELAAGRGNEDVSDLEVIPARTRISKGIPYIIPAIIVGLLVVGFFRSGWDATRDTLLIWIAVNGGLSAIGALIALAHPLTVLVTFLAAPVTSMNPWIGVGFVSGFLEALFKKPRVSDFENLQDDATSVRGFFRNRITHVLLVFFFATLGSVAGTFIGLPVLTRLLAG